MEPTIRQLEVFLAVARAGSFRRAAERVHLSQPALSQHVSALERGLGARLLDRKGRTVTLTEAGRILHDHALRVFATLAGAREGIAELDGVGRGALVVVASTTPGIYLLPAVIAGFEREHPAVSVHLRIANTRVIDEQIRANELDLGVVGGHGLGPGEECLAAGVLDELALIVSPDHPGARRRRLDPSRLGQERFLTREEGSATRAVTEQAPARPREDRPDDGARPHGGDQAGRHGRARGRLRLRLHRARGAGDGPASPRAPERARHQAALQKLLPGSTVVQVVSYLGWRLAGWPGSAVATAAFLLPSAIAMLALSYGYTQLARLPAAGSGVRGMLAVVVGLLLVTLSRVGRPVLRTPLALALAAAAFIVVVAMQVHAARPGGRIHRRARPEMARCFALSWWSPSR